MMTYSGLYGAAMAAWDAGDFLSYSRLMLRADRLAVQGGGREGSGALPVKVGSRFGTQTAATAEVWQRVVESGQAR